MMTSTQAHSYGASVPSSLLLPALLKQQTHTRLLSQRRIRCRSARGSFFSESHRDFNQKSLQSLLAQQYKIATRFIDDKLIDAVSQKDGILRQIVLVTDGVDHRPYRLPWPPATLIFHVSSCPNIQVEKEEKVPKSCLVRYIYAELGESAGSEEWTERLRSAGYQGDRPSIWAMQGISFLGLSELQKILENVGSLAMKGSFFTGELPNTTIGCLNEDAARQLLEKIFMSCGFRIKSISYEKISNDKNSAFDGVHILFVAEQLRLSDDQVTKAMREMELAEESRDEETFEDW